MLLSSGDTDDAGVSYQWQMGAGVCGNYRRVTVTWALVISVNPGYPPPPLSPSPIGRLVGKRKVWSCSCTQWDTAEIVYRQLTVGNIAGLQSLTEDRPTFPRSVGDNQL